MIAAAKVSKLVGGVPPSKLNLRSRKEKKLNQKIKKIMTITYTKKYRNMKLIRRREPDSKFVLILTVLQTAASPTRQTPQ